MKDEKLKENQSNETVGKLFNVSKEFSSIVRNLLGTKPFAQVMTIVPILEKEVLTENEVNVLLNLIGGYPYDEVAQIFVMVKDHIKQKEN
jgi:hypothetical protein